MFMTNGYFSTLAVKACQCALWQGDDGYVSDGNTKRCCDQWENTNAPGVKYSGDWLDEVRNSFIIELSIIIMPLTCLVVQGSR
jgi:hypothetical protein